MAAIFGPSTQATSGIASSICDEAEVPHIITHWDPEPIGRTKSNPMTINLYPDPDVLARYQ